MWKRTFDIVASSCGLLILSPLLLLLGLAIKIDSRGPIFYRGQRVGRFGKIFRIYKFRSMVVDAESLGPSSTPADDTRITRVGAWIRQHKLDELPQLINVLVGDMSLVGPRPQVGWAVDLYTDHERRLLNVRPGITDYASLTFRDEASILAGRSDPDAAYLELIAPEKTRLGLYYVDNHSLWTDLKILGSTALCVFLKSDMKLEVPGANQPSGRGISAYGP
jgi:lipopolysaccharide/colanic/teichoic acid biosynthesis glycosyltransferase